MTTLAETLREQARRQPDTPFLTFESAAGDVAVWSYAELDRRVDGLAAGLERAGLRAGDRFLVVVRNHPVSIALVLAASRTGTVAVAVDPALRARELAVCVDVARPRLIVADARDEVEALGLPVWAAAEPSAADWLGEPPHVNGAATTPSPDGVIELLFTSGTTSRPKAVMWTNAAVLHGARTLARAARYDEADVALVPLSLSHAAAQAHQLWPTLTLGGRVVLLERFSARRFFDQARAHGATTSAHFAASLRMLLRRGTTDGPLPLRHVTFAQSLTRAEFTDWERRIGVPLQHLWGMTETVGLPIMSPLEGDRRLEAMGRAVPGYRVEVRGEQASDGGRVEGELVVAARPGDDVTLGYFGDPDGTASLLRDGVLWTGDVVQRDTDGFLHFVGRHGDIIRRAGLSFSSLEVEEVIRSVEGVVDVAVVGLPDDVRDERVAAVVVADPGVTEEALRARCSAALATYKRPEIIAFEEQLPRTSVGKVRKHLVVERLLDGSPG